MNLKILFLFLPIICVIPEPVEADIYSEAAAFDAGIRLISTLATIGSGGPLNHPAVGKDEIRIDGFDPGTLITLTNNDAHPVCRRTIDSTRGASCQNLESGVYKLLVELRGLKKSAPQTAEVQTGTWTHFTFAGPGQDLPVKP